MVTWVKSAQEFRREVPAIEVFTALRLVIEIQEATMAAIDDLTAAVNAAVAEIATLRGQVGATSSVSDAAAETLAGELNAAVTPAPAPVPTPTPAA